MFCDPVCLVTAVKEILGDRSFNCLDMLVVPGGDEVGIICISDVDVVVGFPAPRGYTMPMFMGELGLEEVVCFS